MKRTVVTAIAILTLVLGMCLVAGGALARESRDYDLTGTWTGYFDNGVVHPEPGVGQPMTWVLQDDGLGNTDSVTGQVYQTTGENDNVVVNYEEGACHFIRLADDQLQYTSELLINGYNDQGAYAFQRTSWLKMTTHDVPLLPDGPYPDQILTISEKPDGTLQIHGQCYFVVRFWQMVLYVPIPIDLTTDQGILHLEKVDEARAGEAIPSRQKAMEGVRQGAMEGYWETDVQSENPNGQYIMDLPVVSQSGSDFTLQDAYMESQTEEFSITIHDAQGTETDGHMVVDLVINLDTAMGLSVLHLEFAGDLTSPTTSQGTFEIWLWTLDGAYTPMLDAGLNLPSTGFTSEKKDIVIDNLDPAEGQAGDTVIINGSEFGDDNGDIHRDLIELGDYSQVTVGGTVADIVKDAQGQDIWSDTQIDITVPNLDSGIYDVVVHRRGVLSNPVSFEVLPTPVLIFPWSICTFGYQGETKQLMMFGENTNWDESSTIRFGDDDTITANIVGVISWWIMFEVTIPPDADPGLRDVTVTTGREVVVGESAFTVVEVTDITEVNPPSVNQGYGNLQVIITGDNTTHWNSGTDVHVHFNNSNGDNLPVTDIAVNSDTEIIATIDIADDAQVGAYDVIVMVFHSGNLPIPGFLGSIPERSIGVGAFEVME